MAKIKGRFWKKAMLLLSIIVPVTVCSADKANFWDASNETTFGVINHSPWDNLLGKYVVFSASSGIRKFRYSDITKKDHKILSDYIRYLSKQDPRDYRKVEQQAYWLNLYNAISVKVVTEYLLELQQVKPNLIILPEKKRDKKYVKVARKKLSLNDIKHQILLPIWKDHRIHFGLNCASMDCPNMDSRAYTSSTVKQQLKTSGTNYINDDRGLKYARGVLTVSKLFDTYSKDFSTDTKTLMKVFAHYAKDKKALYVLGYQGKVHFFKNPGLNMP